MKCFARVKLAFVGAALAAVFLAGSAWALEVELYHSVKVGMNEGVTDFTTPPRFRDFLVRVRHNELPQQPTGTLTGEFTFNFKNAVTVDNDSGKRETLEGSHTFKLWPEDNGFYSQPGDDAGNEIRVVDGGESALSGSAFSYTLTLNGTPISGAFPQVRSVSAQWAAKCVPCIELDFDAGSATVKGVKWRFVNPDDPATPLPTSAVGGLNPSHINIDPLNEDGYVSYSISPPSGSALEGYIDITPISFDNLGEVRFFFHYPEGANSESTVYELWAFEVNDDGGDDISGELVMEADIEAAQAAAAENLTNAPAKIVAVDQDSDESSVFIGKEVIANSSADIIAARTSSIISVKQWLKDGADALAFTHELGFALKPKSLENVALPQPEDFAALKTQYSVLKHFEGGGAIDLLAEFGDKIFSYTPDTKQVALKATIVIIDGPAPDNEPGLRRYYANGKYGVKLAEGDVNYLYIWDGEKNQIASDPIALATKEKSSDNNNNNSNSSSGSSSGCNAGFGLFGFLLVGFVALKRRA